LAAANRSVCACFAAGDVQRDRTGRRNDPHRYWLKGQETKWKAANSLWEYHQEEEQVLREMRGLM
jgi:hypothetical protein